MIDYLLVLDNITNGDFVSNATFVTALGVTLTVFVMVITYIMNKIDTGFKEARENRESGFKEAKQERESGFKEAKQERESGFKDTQAQIQQLRETQIEIKTLLSLNLLREGVDFQTQETAIAKAKAEYQANQENSEKES